MARSSSLSSNAIARELINDVHTYGEIVVRGAKALAVVRQAIQLLAQNAGFNLAFDPASDPKLIDYLASAGSGAIQGGLLGGMAGLLVGALLEHPAEGAAIGAGLGAVIGGLSGLEHVSRGWRVRATWQKDGLPTVAIWSN